MEKTVFNTCTYATRCSLRPQRQTVTITIIEGIHLFLDDISNLTNRAFEQVCLLDDRHTNFVIAVT